MDESISNRPKKYSLYKTENITVIIVHTNKVTANIIFTFQFYIYV